MAFNIDNTFAFLDGLAGKYVAVEQAQSQAEQAQADQWRSLAERTVERSTNTQQSGEQPESGVNYAAFVLPAALVGAVGIAFAVYLRS